MRSSSAILRRRPLIGAAVAAALLAGAGLSHAAGPTLLNVSYDVAREFYKDYQPGLPAHWKKTTGEDVTVNQSHGGSSKQARVGDRRPRGRRRDDEPGQRHRRASPTRGKLLPADWAKRLPNNSAPTTSTTVILVRKGNPKDIKDWADLAKPGVSVVIPNPKITGNGRYTYVAAWGAAIKAGGTPAQARELVQKIFANVPVFDGGGRAATTTFAQRNIGDALCHLRERDQPDQAEFGDNFDVVYPTSTHPGREPGRGDRQGGRQEGHAQAGRGLPASSCGPTRRRRSPPSTSCGRARRRCWRSTPRTSRRCNLFTIDEVLRRLDQGAEGALRRRRDLRPDPRAARRPTLDRRSSDVPCCSRARC